MSVCKVTTRLTLAQNLMVKRFAEANGLSRYEAVRRLIESGLQAHQAMSDEPSAQHLMDAISQLSLRVQKTEALLQRALFVCCVTNAWARHSASSSTDISTLTEQIKQAAESAFQRQLALAKENIQ